MKPLDTRKFGPWALVTGASSGIGAEFARQLAADGVNVVLVARRLNLLDALGQQLMQEFKVQYRAIGIDLSEADFLEKIAAVTNDLDIGLLISNAGTGIPGEFLNSDLDVLQGIVRLNVSSHLALTHYFGQKMAQRGRGGIVLVSALGAAQGIPYMANDAATKAYVSSLGEALNTEFKALGVNVTVLLPGGVDTPVIAKLGMNPARMPIKLVSAEQCVQETLAALSANRATLIPGRLFRFMAALTPSKLMNHMNGRMLRKAVLSKQAG